MTRTTLLFISAFLSLAAIAVWAYIDYLRGIRHLQQIYIDALKRQLEAAERIIQRGLYDEETLRKR